MHPTAYQVIVTVYQKLSEEFEDYLESGAREEKERHLAQDAYRVENISGDVINEFLREKGLVVRKSEVRKSGNVILNCGAIEKFFKNELLYQLSNFYVE